MIDNPESARISITLGKKEKMELGSTARSYFGLVI